MKKEKIIEDIRIMFSPFERKLIIVKKSKFSIRILERREITDDEERLIKWAFLQPSYRHSPERKD